MAVETEERTFEFVVQVKALEDLASSYTTVIDSKILTDLANNPSRQLPAEHSLQLP